MQELIANNSGPKFEPWPQKAFCILFWLRTRSLMWEISLFVSARVLSPKPGTSFPKYLLNKFFHQLQLLCIQLAIYYQSWQIYAKPISINPHYRHISLIFDTFWSRSSYSLPTDPAKSLPSPWIIRRFMKCTNGFSVVPGNAWCLASHLANFSFGSCFRNCFTLRLAITAVFRYFSPHL